MQNKVKKLLVGLGLKNTPMWNGTVQDCSRKHLMASLSARHPSAMHLLYDFHIILT